MEEPGSWSHTAARALRQASQIWGEAPRAWDRIEPAWLAQLLSGAEDAATSTTPEVLQELRRWHEAQTRPDLRRIHPSWVLRAIQDEPPSIRGVLVHGLGDPIAAALRQASGPEPPPPGPADPDLVACVLSLWSERLVGDLPDPAADPPVLKALTGPERTRLVKLLVEIGLVKRAYDPVAPCDPSWAERLRERFRRVQVLWGPRDDALLRIAQRDVARFADGSTTGLTHLGLITVARLLTQVEARRVRWALQHLPYGVAKEIRSRMKGTAPDVRRSEVLAWEDRVLRLAGPLPEVEANPGGLA